MTDYLLMITIVNDGNNVNNERTMQSTENECQNALLSSFAYVRDENAYIE